MKNKNIVESFKNAANGIIYVLLSERNMKIHIVAALIALISGIFFKLTEIEFVVVIIAIAFVLITELLNTAVEAIVDIIVDVYHPKAKIIKDAAAGAVLIAALSSAVIGCIIFIPKVLKLIILLML